MQYTGGIGPMSGRFFLNGPLIKDKLSFTAGVRAAYPDLILNQFGRKFGSSRAFFYDGITKAEYTFNPKNKLPVTAYQSYDRFRFDTSTSYNWETNLVSLNFISEISSKVSLKLNANYSQFISTINGLDKYADFNLVSSITQKQVKPVIVIKANDKHTIETGVDFILYGISPGVQKPSSDSSSINPLLIQKEQGKEMAAFISDKIDFTDRISLQLGLRYASYKRDSMIEHGIGAIKPKNDVMDDGVELMVFNSPTGFVSLLTFSGTFADSLLLKKVSSVLSNFKKTIKKDPVGVSDRYIWEVSSWSFQVYDGSLVYSPCN